MLPGVWVDANVVVPSIVVILGSHVSNGKSLVDDMPILRYPYPASSVFRLLVALQYSSATLIYENSELEIWIEQ